MRRRRHALQVSTFPFLAVLLCTMGSLILILLVIDRRAKVVARAKLEAERADRVASARMSNRKRQEEWERRRQALHGLLAREVEEVHDKAKTAKGKADTTTQLTKAERDRIEELRRKIEAERSGLLLAESEVKASQAKVQQNTKETGIRQADLARMAANLDVLERTLADLKAARQRQSQTYSLVPYRGKHGDNRRPIYLECSGGGLTFHPDRYTLAYPLNSIEVRAEVKRRIERLRAIQPNKDDDESPAYLLMLLRPTGITNYYQILAALVGLKVDFGYEMVDENWVLDFSEDENSRTPQPWMTAGNAMPPRSPPVKPPPGVPIQGPGGFVAGGNSAGGGPRQPSGDIRRAGGPVIIGGNRSSPGNNGNGNSGSGAPWRSPTGNPRGVAAGNGDGGLGNPYGNGLSPGGAPGSNTIPGNAGPLASGRQGTGPYGGSGSSPLPLGSQDTGAAGNGTPGTGNGGTAAIGSAGSASGTGNGGAPGNGGSSPGNGVAGGSSASGGGMGIPGTSGQGGNSMFPGQPGNGNGTGLGTGANGPRLLASAGGNGTGQGGNGLYGGSGTGNSPGTSGATGNGTGTAPGSGNTSGTSNGIGTGSSPGGRNGTGNLPNGNATNGLPAQGGNGNGNSRPGNGAGAAPNGNGSGGSGTSDGGSSTAGGGTAGSGGSGANGGTSGSGGTSPGGDPSANGGTGAPGTPGSGSAGSASASSAGQQAGSAGSPGSAASSSGGTPTPTFNLSNNAQKPPSSSSAGGPPPNTMNTGPGANPNSSTTSAKTGEEGSWVPGGGGSSSGGGGEGVPGVGGGSLLPGGGSGNPPPVQSRPARLLSNRDWPIVLDCRQDGVVLPFGDERISTDRLSSASGQNSPLYQVIKQLIDRRQASVRSGEMPFRPSIRFRVHPDGLRTYYFAYPALESLRLPMTRENVYPEVERR